MKKNYYEILEVSPQATDEEIRKAFKELSKKFHPDLNNDDNTSKERFQEINEAYQVLGDEQKRKQYDITLNVGTNIPKQSSTNNTATYDFFDGIFGDITNYINKTGTATISIEVEYKRLLEFIDEKEKEFKTLGLSLQNYRKMLEEQKDTLTLEQIKNHKNEINSSLEKFKQRAKAFDNFQTYYIMTIKDIQSKGGTVDETLFAKLTDKNNRVKLEIEEYKKGEDELRELYYAQLKIHSNKIQELNRSLQAVGLTLTDILLKKSYRSSAELTEKDIEETHEKINIIKNIKANLNSNQMNLTMLLAKLNRSLKDLSLEELRIIDKNVLDFIIKDRLSKWNLKKLASTVETEISTKHM